MAGPSGLFGFLIAGFPARWAGLFELLARLGRKTSPVFRVPLNGMTWHAPVTIVDRRMSEVRFIGDIPAWMTILFSGLKGHSFK